jgi:hypothetical protein
MIWPLSKGVRMFFMTRGLPVLLELGLLIYCLIDCAQTPPGAVRNLPKWAWIMIIFVLPLFGSLGWLLAGRPPARGADVPWPSTGTAGSPEYGRPARGRAVGPDDDPGFLAGLDSARDHERLLKDWEDDLRRREEGIKDSPDTDRPDADEPPDDLAPR